MKISLKRKKIPLVDLYLDPQNPRFLQDGTKKYEESEITSQESQQYCSSMLADNADSLKKTIISQTFIPMDSIVVRPILNEPSSYVVLEGNRRVNACKLIMEEHLSEGLNTENEEDVISSIQNLDCLIYDEDPPDPEISWKLQGLRHVTGVKNWSPYAQAHHVATLVKSGMQMSEIADMLGLKGSAKIMADMRAYRDFHQMKDEGLADEFGVTNNNFSYVLESVGSRPAFQNWLQYDKVDEICKNKDNLRDLVKGFTINEEKGQPNIPKAIDMRDLAKALKMGREDYVSEVLDGEKSIDELRFDLKDSANTGLSPIIASIQRAIENLGLINTNHYDESNTELNENLTSLERAMKSVREKLDKG